METKSFEKANEIKEKFRGTAEKSKETIKEIIDSNARFIDKALDSNKVIVDSIKERLNQQEINDEVTPALKNKFRKSVELAEEALDSILNSYSRQIELNIDSNTKLIDAIKESGAKNPEKVWNTILENFEASRQLTTKSTKEILEFYNKHTNLAVNFNQQFGSTINAQIDSLFKIQSSGLNTFNEWSSEWWKHHNEKEAMKH